MSPIFRIHVLSLVMLMMSLALVSCRDEGVDGEVAMNCVDIVTFEGNEDGHAVFTFNKVDDTPVITLTSTGELSGVNEGTRLLISYVPESNQAYTSGPISLRGVARITGSPVANEWKDEYDAWDKDPVYVYSVWRSGRYLNLHVRLTYSTVPRVFCLALDPATAESAWPELYLVHVLSTDVDYHDRAYYASFDMESVWSSPSVRGVRVHISDTNQDKHIFTFEKSEMTE